MRFRILCVYMLTLSGIIYLGHSVKTLIGTAIYIATVAFLFYLYKKALDLT